MTICSRCKKNITVSQYKHCEKCREYNKNYRASIETTYKQGEFSSKDGVNKTCRKCLVVKPLRCFYKHKRYKDGYRNDCIICHNILFKEYYIQTYNIVLKNKFNTDKAYRLKQNIKSYIFYHLKNNRVKKSLNTLDYLKCSLPFYLKWLNRNIIIPNIEYNIDHVYPISKFDLSNDQDIFIAFSWVNTRLITKRENLEKYNKFSMIEFINHVISVYRYIRYTSKDYSLLKIYINYIKNKYYATPPNCGDTLRDNTTTLN